jgi:hypothetical protein
MGVIGLALLIPLLWLKPLYLTEVALSALCVYLAFSHRRMLFVFGIVIAPVLTRLLAGLSQAVKAKRSRILPNAVQLTILILVICLAFPGPRKLEQEKRAAVPDGAVDYIRRSGLSGNMLNLYDWGGYLIWALPEHKVFIDGRGDVFEWTGVLKEYQDWAVLESDPRTLLEKHHIAFCLLARSTPMSRILPLLPGWTQVYSDESSMVFAKSDPSGAGIPRGETFR